MDRPRNPFVIGPRIPRPYFCDRVEEQKLLTSAVINGRNVVLVSPRRMGKTALAYAAIHDSEEIQQDFMIIFFDILQTNSLSEFTYLFGKTIFNALASKSESRLRGFLAALKSLKGCFGFDPFDGTPTFDIQLGDIKRPEFTLEEIFGYIEESGRPMIIIIDEFQQITRYPEKNIEAVLRSHIQKLTNATFVFAGSERTILQEMFVSSNRPFYNSAELMHLRPIAEDIYVKFAQRLFRERDKEIEEEPIRWAFRLFDGNTFYLQRTMNGGFAETATGEKCDKDIVEATVRNMLQSNEVIYREILSNVSVSNKAVLIAIAEEHEVANPMSGEFVKSHALLSPSSVQNALKKLMQTGLIYKSDKTYSLTDPLLRIFINSLYSQREF